MLLFFMGMQLTGLPTACSICSLWQNIHLPTTILFRFFQAMRIVMLFCQKFGGRMVLFAHTAKTKLIGMAAKEFMNAINAKNDVLSLLELCFKTTKNLCYCGFERCGISRKINTARMP